MSVRVLAVVGARLNSSRLPKKHLLALAGRPLIEHLFARLDQVGEIDHRVLATTADAYNQPLVDWAQRSGREVFAYAGDVNDLVGRVDAVVQRLDPAFVVYVCGDSPLIEPTTMAAMLRALLDDAAADLVTLAPSNHGPYIHEGFSIYPRRVWTCIVAASRTAAQREHVGSALAEFAADLRRIEMAERPIFAGVRQRISVDTPSDFAFMAEVYRRWYDTHPSGEIVSLEWLIGELQRDPALAALNAHVHQKRVGEHSPPVLIVCQAGALIGLGHLTRALCIARALQDELAAAVLLLIQAEPVARHDLALIPHRFVAADADLAAEVRQTCAAQATRAVVFDLHPERCPADMAGLVASLRADDIRLIGIDAALRWGVGLDLVVVPAIGVDAELRAACPAPVEYGWPWLLLSAPLPRPAWRPAADVLVLIGGSDVASLGHGLPALIDRHLPAGTRVRWVRGPYAPAPCLPAAPRLDWAVLDAPDGLAEPIRQCHYALTVFGVSCFELLAAGVPSVVFSPYPGGNRDELAGLAREAVAWVANDAPGAVKRLAALMADAAAASGLAIQAAARLDAGGGRRLAQRIGRMLE